MRYIYVLIMATSAVLAFYLSSRIIYNGNIKRRLNRLFTITAFGSGLWSLGYAGMYATTNEAYFVIFRASGMIGMILFLITAQLMLYQIAEKKIHPFGVISVEAIVGVIILGIVINPGCIRMLHAEDGTIMTKFINSFLSLAYTLYTVCVAICYTVIVVIIIRTSPKKRVVAFGKNFLHVELIVVLGMIIDTVLPAFGINLNIPASTILQFIGLELIYIAVHKIGRNRISITNMSGYIYRSMKTPVIIFDSNDTLQVYNEIAAEVFGLDAVDKSNYNFWEKEFGIDESLKLNEAHETVIFEKKYKTDKDFRIYIDAIHDDYDDYLGYIVTINDISEIVNNMNELKIMKDEALSANKAKSLFLANMSHEIRTPMNSILGFSELALMDNIDPVARGYLEDIKYSASALLTIINDILDISKIESGKMELVCDNYYPERLFKDVSLIIGMHADKKNLDFEMNISPDFPSVLWGDKTKIREILINLLNNSVKYTNAGKVCLAATFIRDDNNDTGTMKLVVSDTGIGIKEEEIDTVFGAFQRVDLSSNKNTEGTGLGLSITKGYTDLMNGSISVSSVYGKGTTFTVEISQKVISFEPLSMENRDRSDISKEQLRFKDINVLAVDDSKINLKVINMTMAHYGLEIDLAASGEEAIELCKNKAYDIVLMDQMMPEMDGIEAMKRIRELGGGYEKGGNKKIIVLTANAIAGTKEILINEGFDDYLGKPIDLSVLEHVFINILPEDKYYKTRAD